VEHVAVAHSAGRILSDADYGGGAAVQVVRPGAVAPDVPPADLVVSLDAPSRARPWEAHVRALGRLARKVLVVFVRNPERPRLRLGAPAPGLAEVAGVLWSVGRVRERAYLGLPALLARRVGHDDAIPVPVGFFVRRTAALQAFVVDTTPRTPQARRRLRTVAEEGRKTG
jgi:hypothetical protein